VNELHAAYVAQGGQPFTDTEYNKFAVLLLPLIDSVLADRYTDICGSIDDTRLDDVRNRVLLYILRNMNKRAFPLERDRFQPYLRTSITNKIISAFREVSPRFEPTGNVISESDLPRNLDHEPVVYDDLDAVIDNIDPPLPPKSSTQIFDYTLRYVTLANRFSNLSPALLKYMVTEVLSGRVPSKAILKNFGASDSIPFYVRYIEVLVIAALYDMRSGLHLWTTAR